MALLGFFRRSPPIRDLQALADFIDEQAAFLIQKGLFEYSRARAGHYAKTMIKEPEFQGAVNISRWRAYPLGLAMVGEMTEGVLRPLTGRERTGTRSAYDAYVDLVLSVFDRYATPKEMGEQNWGDARSELALLLEQISLHPPKRVIDIPVPYAKRYFGLMPIHKNLLTNDEPTTLSFLKLNLVNIREELVKRMDAMVIAAQLREAAEKKN